MKREIADSSAELRRAGGAPERGPRLGQGDPPHLQRPQGLLRGIVNGDPDPIELIRDGRTDEVWTIIDAAKEKHAAAVGASA